MYVYKHGVLLIAAVSLLSLRCTGEQSEAPANTEAHAAQAAAPTNRVPVPEKVRENLGITFARVELRKVEQTIRVPGQFELVPEARREYRTMMPGRVEVLVKQLDSVAEGMPLYQLESPEWRELQQELNDSIKTILQAEARVSSIPKSLSIYVKLAETLREKVANARTRVKQIEENRASGVVSDEERVNIHNQLLTRQAELDEVLLKKAELEAQSVTAHADHEAAHGQWRLLLSNASSIHGITQEALTFPHEIDPHLHVNAGTEPAEHEHLPTTQPASLWRDLNKIEVKAAVPGIVESIGQTNGAWASAGDLVLATIEPQRLRFRAMGWQSDLGRLRDGLPARIVPPRGGSIKQDDTMEATLKVGLLADPEERTIELFADPTRVAGWAKRGVSAHLEVIQDEGTPELAILRSCVIPDGFEKIIFRRDPKNPDQVIRMEADLGKDDGRWVVVKSGLREGDEVVLDGVFQLMVATSGTVQKGGHFHADGSFHEGKDH